MNWQEVIDRYKLPIGLIFVGILLMIFGTFATTHKKEIPKESIVSASQRKIKVDISGQVNKPGVYEFEENSRIQDAIDISGGFTEDASADYVAKKLNLAQKLIDGSKIYIPREDESGVSAISIQESSKQVNINSASQAELENLSGIGAVTASKIIDGRPYQKIEELLDKKILSKSTFEKLKNYLIVY